MKNLDITALENNFEAWKLERAAELPRSQAFEHYAVEQVLKDYELSDEEIEGGMLRGPGKGGNDGGVDSMYFFVNGILVSEEWDVPTPAERAEIHLLQTKFETGFGETTIEKIETFTRDLLNFEKAPVSFTYLNSDAQDAIDRFRKVFSRILGTCRSITLSYSYVTKSVEIPNPNVQSKVERLRETIKERLSSAIVNFEFWGSSRLLERAFQTPSTMVLLPVSKHFPTDDGSCVCLVRLDDYATFLTDDGGQLRLRFLEPNIRDFQGINNPV